ncbi:6-phosphogluconolactonase [Pneumocystis carinii B80]|uniref:6-phosphogluconolactonase n=1 Tax=Pneumocystis carinii (strain B80) TaxID=1408658 RepID=A0A0W4ZNF0_PNEC8|nr:6-phosphogluconolactonase [Pneumocystis carinii B80]KTW29899.1 6-phosphogluconolactonase [Pneumocystis carinii B80]
MATLYSFQTKDDLRNALYQYIKKAYDESIIKHSKFNVAISGGSLPKILGENIENLKDIDWNKWEIFFADERVVPLYSQDSNYKLCYDEFFMKLPIPIENIHSIDISLLNDPEKLSKAYESVLMKKFSIKNTKKFPEFDLLLLGCGEDGHTCSLFPNHKSLQENTSWVISITNSPKPPSIRITLSLPVIINAQRIVFIALGEKKREIMKRIWNDIEELPCSLINIKANCKVLWFSDISATELVDEKIKKQFKL